METAVVIAGPKIVGHVDLTKFDKKKKVAAAPASEKPKAANKPLMFGTFKLELFKKVLGVALDANKKIYKDAITVSKTAKIRVDDPKNKGKFKIEDKPGYGSIWFTCSKPEFEKNFLYNYRIMERCVRFGIRKATKGEVLNMLTGLNFYFMYIKDDMSGIEIIKNVKLEGDNTAIIYHGEGQTLKYSLSASDINNDGSFNTGVAGEKGFIFVSDTTEA